MGRTVAFTSSCHAKTGLRQPRELLSSYSFNSRILRDKKDSLLM
jgi:hypothetical protein